eukprot:UN13090
MYPFSYYLSTKNRSNAFYVFFFNSLSSTTFLSRSSVDKVLLFFSLPRLTFGLFCIFVRNFYFLNRFFIFVVYGFFSFFVLCLFWWV